MPGQERTLTLRFLAEPADVNFGGKVHGGAVMKWIDLCAYGCAAGWSGKYCITAYVGGMHFVKPILVGSMVVPRLFTPAEPLCICAFMYVQVIPKAQSANCAPIVLR